MRTCDSNWYTDLAISVGPGGVLLTRPITDVQVLYGGVKMHVLCGGDTTTWPLLRP